MVGEFLKYVDEIWQTKGNSMESKVDSDPVFLIHFTLKWVYSEATLEAQKELVDRVIFQLHHA